MTRHVLLFLAVALVVAAAAFTLLLSVPSGGCQVELCGPMQHVWNVS